MDFTSCKRIISKAYNGANGKKIAVEYEGKRYMLKFPPSGKIHVLKHQCEIVI